MKKLLAMLLILALMLSLTPAAFADETPEEAAPIEEPVEEEPAAEEPTAEEPAAEEPVEEEPAAEPAEEPAGDPAHPAEESGSETNAPAEGTDAPAEGTDPAAPAEQNGEGDGEDAAGGKADDGPEYGVQPADEKKLPEEEKEDKKPEREETEEEPGITVVFRCEPQETTVVVFGSGGRIGTVTGGMILLAPGEYTYDASCDGYYPQEGVSFTVSAPETAAKDAQLEQTVTVELCLLDEGGFFEDEDEPLALRTAPPAPLVVLHVEPGPDRRTPTVFRQGDSRWAASPYGYLNGNSPGTIAASGCGILALTNAVYYLNGFFVDPSFAADYAAGTGFHVAGGTKWDFYRGFAQTYGTSYGVQYVGEVTTYTELKNMLLRDCVAICSVPGHIMTIVDYDEALGRFLLLDSAPDDLRATGAGYVWASEQELCAMPSRVYDYDGLYPRFVLLRAVGVLDVNGLLDGEKSDSLGSYGTFDVWVDGEKVANDQSEYRAVLPRGTSYRIDDVRAKGAHRCYGVQEGALQGSISCGTAAEVVLGFGTRDYVTEPEPELPNTPPAGSSPPTVCAHWAGGVIGPTLTLPLPKA